MCPDSNTKTATATATAKATATPTARATDPPPTNSTTMHSRLVCQDRHFCFGEQAYLPIKKSPNPQTCQTLKKKVS